MSKINQIESEIKKLSAGSFQKLADAYLHKKGYDRINPVGAVVGSDKTKKGTPDTFITLPNGKYVFAEYTTQQDDLFSKLDADLKKCFDENKTKLAVSKINEIVICHSSMLNAAEENALTEKCQKRGVILNIYGIGPIAYDLYQKYPGLAKEFLGVEVDTGQILPPEEFIAAYNKNKLATKLDTRFHFRNAEIDCALHELEKTDLLIINGRAGVGKSRFALECCHLFKDRHPDFSIYCVYNKGPDLFEDLRVHFSAPGHFLILVDDANRITRFDYAIQLLQEKQEARIIKVIATVRDYALDKIREATKPYGSAVEMELPVFEESQLKQIVESEYGIRNHLFLDRIAEIAKGNPRLAIMCAEVANREGTLSSIADVSTLYDEYFASIRKDFEDLENAELLKTAGIISFFRAVDRSYDAVMSSISKAFHISPTTFWTNARKLHELEVCDIYENEVVRTEDQVLSTYLFYLAFFKVRVMDFGVLLEHFFPAQRSRLVDVINPVLASFDAEKITNLIRPHVQRNWKALKQTADEKSLLHLLDVFWFVDRTETLLYVQNQISKISPEPVDIDKIEFKTTADTTSPSILIVLSSFEHAEIDNFIIALNLLYDYIEKLPGEVPKLMRILVDRFGFEPESYAFGYSLQRTVIEQAWLRTQNGSNAINTRIFLVLADAYLNTYYHAHRYKGEHTFSIIKFHLAPTAELFELRKTLLNRLFELYENVSFQPEVLEVIYNYSTSGYKISGHEIILHDSMMILPFLRGNLNTSSYRHCLIVQEYLDFLEERKVDFPMELRERFKSDIYSLSEILLLDFAEKRTLHLDYEAYQKYKREQIRSYFEDYTLDDYKRFFDHCSKIREGISTQRTLDYKLPNGILEAFSMLAEKDPTLFQQTVKYYLELGDPFSLNPYIIMNSLFSNFTAIQVFDDISQSQYPMRKRWQINFYELIPADDVKPEHLDHLLELYKTATVMELPHSLDFLLKFRAIDSRAVARLIGIILEKTAVELQFGHALSMLFNPNTEANKVLIDLFAGEFSLLKQAYFAAMKVERHLDFDSRTFTQILNADNGFIEEYIDHIYSVKEHVSKYDDSRDYSILWLRDDHAALLRRAIERIYKHESSNSRYYFSYLERFFTVREGGQNNAAIIDRQDRLLKALIIEKHSDKKFVKFLFDLIAEFSGARRRALIDIFLKYTKKFEDFENLHLDSMMHSWSGSAVPMLQERLEYLQSLLPLLNTVDLLLHRRLVERRINGIRTDIEREKKSDFIEKT